MRANQPEKMWQFILTPNIRVSLGLERRQGRSWWWALLVEGLFELEWPMSIVSLVNSLCGFGEGPPRPKLYRSIRVRWGKEARIGWKVRDRVGFCHKCWGLSDAGDLWMKHLSIFSPRLSDAWVFRGSLMNSRILIEMYVVPLWSAWKKCRPTTSVRFLCLMLKQVGMEYLWYAILILPYILFLAGYADDA